jgi:hypothetical protein
MGKLKVREKLIFHVEKLKLIDIEQNIPVMEVLGI